MKTAVFTIASRNYFAFVRSLMSSLEKTNENWDRYVVVVDDISEEFDAIPKNFKLVSLDDLDLPKKGRMAFRYSIMEFNTAVKPFAISFLFEKLEYDRVVYLDPDIFVYEKLREVEQALDTDSDFVLTPHLTGMWEEDGRMPDEPSIMRAGIYNLGFIAMNNCAETREMTHWWEKKLEYQCIVDVQNGIFVDQKWIDLVPGRYQNVCILQHEGYNTAYWNLSHRKAEKRNGKYFFNGQPLIFFHFSGFNPQKKYMISKHSDRFTINQIGPAKELFEEYAESVLGNEFDMWKKFEYAYSSFSDGRKILDLFRTAYRESEYLQELCGDDPYQCADVFYTHQRQGIIEFMLKYVWKSRVDLQSAFPNGITEEYMNWFKNCAQTDYGIPRKYLEDARVNEEKVKEYVPDMKFRIKNTLHEVLPGSVWNVGRHVYRTFRPKKAGITKAAITVGMVEVSAEKEKTEDEIQLADGVNLIGYIRSEHGVGEGCRATAQCLQQTDINWQAYDYETGNGSRQNDHSFDQWISDKIRYNISIFNINADQMYVARENTPKEAWNGYNIGIWFWELMEFPDDWCESFKLVDEIWAPTRFIEESLKRKATCPVIYMPPGIEREMPDKKYNRAYFELPENTFLFLNMFDSLSYQSRKNPKAAIEAFKKAFSADDMTAGLVVKLNNQVPGSQEMQELEEMKHGYKNIYLIPKTFTRDEINGLICTCDAAVSLHRSEGLGLLCKEAMYFGKPVIATNWSGNTDFMNEDNSCMVGYDLVHIGEDVGPYKFWQKWAEVHVDEAKEYMVRLKNDKEYYQDKAAQASKMMREQYSVQVCGLKMQKRLWEILKNECI